MSSTVSFKRRAAGASFLCERYAARLSGELDKKTVKNIQNMLAYWKNLSYNIHEIKDFGEI